ncbi:DUF1120 domain-containing protein [Paraburkholderia saeva]|uniref:Protein GltF n=1 Tax=Paraburkholderia saeva TaxID=2777537 RepID=A0A9N8RZ71_9BURK|nr:DUF1120 domain-containing protein [Paraburkholderia saeva]CAG4903726.1 Protein GltF [Paraburkholderia saeva]CAG4905573.1 Protein GltF [Paraburkholderia saeva]CAG4909491.1 Protein GltF [Paraburkholderia saeva]
MKLISKNTLLAALLAATSVGAFAADSVDLKIIGTIAPTSCTPTLAGGGVVDFGTIPASTINANSFTNIGTKTTSVTVTCDAPAVIAIKLLDNRASSLASGVVHSIDSNHYDVDGYGLGTVNGINIGAYVVRMSGQGTGDGAAVDNIWSDNATTWTKASTASAVSPTKEFRSWATPGTLTPAAHTVFSQNFSIMAGVNKGSALPLNQDIPLDGLVTFSMVYL